MYVEYKDYGVIFENRNFDGVIWYQPRALSESLSDSVTSSDSLVKGISPVYADSASASDEIAKLLAKPLDDSVSTSDDLVKLVSMVLSDSATPSDAAVKDISFPLADSVSLSDDLVKHPSIPLNDSVSVSDDLTGKDIGINLSDSVIASDSKYVAFEDRDGVLFQSRTSVIWVECGENIVKDVT